MKITKPKENQILLEDDNFVNFSLETSSKTGLSDSEFNEAYGALALAYRIPGMDASKQIFYGDQLSIMTMFSSMVENLLKHNIMSEEDLDDCIDFVKKVVRGEIK